MDDVAIIGVGLHPFGRFGAKSAIDMGADAIRAALGDAGVQWKDVQVAFGGSFEVDNPDAVVSRLGLTGIPFMDVYNGCATAATALKMTADAIRSGQYDIGVAVGMDKHEPGAFTSDPVDYAAPAWYGEIGHFLTTKFFAMKINRYMHDHGISSETLAKVAAKAYRNGVLNPNALRRKAISEEDILGSRMLNHPLTQYMFCSPDEGAAAVVLCRADLAKRYTVDAGVPAGDDPAHPALRVVRGPCVVVGRRAGRRPHRVRVAGGLRAGRHRARRRRRHPAAGHGCGRGGHPHGGERLLRGWRAGEAHR